VEQTPVYEPPAVEEIDCQADVLGTASMISPAQ
jgi:hypothetical protein